MYENFKLSNSQYIPQFAGLPLDTVEKVGDELQGRHYDNIAKLRQLELLGLQQKANSESDADKSYIDNQVGGIQSALSEMAKTGAENSTSKISALANQYLGDEGLINIGKSISTRQKEKEYLEKLGGKGVMNNKALEDWKKRGSYNKETGKWEPYTMSAQEQLDYVKKADQIFDPLRANTYQTDLVADLKTTLGAFDIQRIMPGVSGDISKIPAKFKTTLIERLSNDKINDFIENKGGWESYKNSSEYTQQKNVLGMDDAAIKEEFRSRGYAKVYEKISKDWETNPMLGAIKAGPVDETLDTASVDIPNVQVKNDPLGSMDDFRYKKRQATEYVGRKQSNSGAPGPGATAKLTDYNGPARGIEKAEWEKFNKHAKVAAEVFGVPGWGNLDENSSEADINGAADAVEKYRGLVENRVITPKKKVGRYVRAQQEGRDIAKDETTDLIRNYNSAVFYDPQSGEVINPTKNGAINEDLLELVGGDLENMQITGDLDPKNHFAKMKNIEALSDAYVVQVTDPKTKEKKDIFVSRPISKNPALTAYNKGVNKIYSNFNLEPGVQQEVEVFGKKVKGKELIGRQLDEHISKLPREQKDAIQAMQARLGPSFMPVLAEINGEEVLFNGPDDLAQYLMRN